MKKSHNDQIHKLRNSQKLRLGNKQRQRTTWWATTFERIKQQSALVPTDEEKNQRIINNRKCAEGLQDIEEYKNNFPRTDGLPLDLEYQQFLGAMCNPNNQRTTRTKNEVP